MTRVHPQSIVDDSVELGPEVEIGPWCMLQGPIRVGAGSRLIAQVHLQGPLELGDRNVLYPGTCLGFAPQDHSFAPDRPGAGLVVGAENLLREGVTMHRATGQTPTRVGDGNMFMAHSHVGHDASVGSRCILTNAALLGGHAHLADGAILSGHAAVHQFCHVGRLAMIGGQVGVTQDVPPFCTSVFTRFVSALNLVGLRRAGLRAHIGPLKHAFTLLYRRGLSGLEAAQAIEREVGHDPLCREMADFVRTSHADAGRRRVMPYGCVREQRRRLAGAP